MLFLHRWGFFQTGSGTPADKPAMLSRSIDLEYLSLPCKYAFNITSPPNISKINDVYGGFGIEYPRLAFIGGQADPWKEATPFAEAAHVDQRRNTMSTPLFQIEGGVHHCKKFPKNKGAFSLSHILLIG